MRSSCRWNMRTKFGAIYFGEGHFCATITKFCWFYPQLQIDWMNWGRSEEWVAICYHLSSNEKNEHLKMMSRECAAAVPSAMHHTTISATHGSVVSRIWKSWGTLLNVLWTFAWLWCGRVELVDHGSLFQLLAGAGQLHTPAVCSTLQHSTCLDYLNFRQRVEWNDFVFMMIYFTGVSTKRATLP